MAWKTYSIRKSHHILKAGYKSFKKKGSQLTPHQLSQLEAQLRQLDTALLEGNKQEASRLAHEVEEFCDTHFKKSIPNYLVELIFAILVALAVATVIRQTWFEPYEIPTGSMRPTFKEKDHLTVTKTAFALNIPLVTDHFYFDPNLVQRLSVITWSGEGVPHLDSEATFMGLVPYTKRYIKRCMGKPGDTLYFYGGKLYGFDAEGNELEELTNNPWMARLESVPFTSFEGRRSYVENRRLGLTDEVTFHHFNQLSGRLLFKNQQMLGEVFNGKTWVKDNPEAQATPHDTIETYSDLWGMRNFALARLLNRDQLESLTPFSAKDLGEAVLYLELRHTPSLNYPSPLESSRFGIGIKGYTTVIPLQEKHLQALMKNMYTCRFLVKNEKAASYRQGEEKISATSPSFPGVPDGTYEFYYGKGVSVSWGGVTFPLPEDSPLYSTAPKDIQKLFNIGIEMNTYVDPHTRNQPFFPSRYVYFREGDLYAMGGVLMTKDDPTLKSFNEREMKREQVATKRAPYVAFKDYGPPLNKEGKLDKAFISTFGYKVPDGKYLLLGDNHAMSQDCRYFGPVPAANLEGAPSLIIWPPGDRWGIPNQKPYPLFTLPRVIVWGIALIILLISYAIYRRNLKTSVFKDS